MSSIVTLTYFDHTCALDTNQSNPNPSCAAQKRVERFSVIHVSQALLGLVSWSSTRAQCLIHVFDACLVSRPVARPRSRKNFILISFSLENFYGIVFLTLFYVQFHGPIQARSVLDACWTLAWWRDCSGLSRVCAVNETIFQLYFHLKILTGLCFSHFFMSSFMVRYTRAACCTRVGRLPADGLSRACAVTETIF